MRKHILIESQWNLNAFRLIEIAISVPILIESQWNLNPLVDAEIWDKVNILIESQWNLNLFYSMFSYISSHINRITVEFKLC